MARTTDDPKEHVIPLRVNKEEWTVARLKAAVYCRGNMSAFLRKSIEAYDGPLPELKCFHCQTPLVYGFDGTVNWDQVTVHHVPQLTCPQCGDQSFDMAVMEPLETALDGKTGVIDFRELMDLAVSKEPV